jgi:hypothetical protein
MGMLHFILGLVLVAVMAQMSPKKALHDTWVPNLLALLFPAFSLGEAMGEINGMTSKNKCMRS